MDDLTSLPSASWRTIWKVWCDDFAADRAKSNCIASAAASFAFQVFGSGIRYLRRSSANPIDLTCSSMGSSYAISALGEANRRSGIDIAKVETRSLVLQSLPTHLYSMRPVTSVYA